MSKNKSFQRPNFLKDHADTLAIISVNIAIAAILITMFISNSHRIDAVNSRSDALYVLCYDMLKEIKH